MKTTSVLIKPASDLCNMRCDYCFYCDETSKRSTPSFGFMSEETLRNVIRRTLLPTQGPVAYAFQGGEPTLRGLEFFEKALEYQKKYNRNNVPVHNALQTNGYAITEEWATFLQKNNFLTGLSVDGTPAIHDLHRHDKSGGPTFERIEKAARILDRCGAQYNILTVVTRQVAEHIEEIYNFYKTKGWHYQQYIACMDPLNELRGQQSHALLPSQYGQFLTKLFDLWYADYLKGKQPYIRQFENYAGILMGYQPESCEQRGVCGLQYVVEADGSVYPCDFYALDQYLLGNFNADRLEQLDARREEIGFIAPSLRLSNTCRSCPYLGICRGGCQRNRELAADGNYINYFCQGFQVFFENCLGRLQEIAKNAGNTPKL